MNQKWGGQKSNQFSPEELAARWVVPRCRRAAAEWPGQPATACPCAGWSGASGELPYPGQLSPGSPAAAPRPGAAHVCLNTWLFKIEMLRSAAQTKWLRAARWFPINRAGHASFFLRHRVIRGPVVYHTTSLPAGLSLQWSKYLCGTSTDQISYYSILCTNKMLLTTPQKVWFCLLIPYKTATVLLTHSF